MSVSRLLAVLCCLLLPVSMVAAWVEGIVTNTDRYVATVGPLASEPTIQTAVEARLEESALDYIDVDARAASLTQALEDRNVDPWLQDRADDLVEALGRVVETAVVRAVTQVVRGEEFRPAWDAANRSAHETALEVLEDDDSAVSTDGSISVQMATLLNSVFGILIAEGLITEEQVPEIPVSFKLLDADQLDEARTAYRVVDAVGLWMPVLWLVLTVLTVMFARSRRAILGWLGWGSILAMLALGGVLWWLRGEVVATVGDSTEREVVEAIWTILFTRLRDAMLVVIILAITLLLGRWLLGRGQRRSGTTAQEPPAA